MAFTRVIIVVLSLLSAALIYYLQTNYIDNHSLYWDPVAYQYYNIKTFLFYQENGFTKTIIYIFNNVSVNPFYHYSLLLINPNLLATPTGHIYINAFGLAIFTLLYSILIFSNSRSIMFTFAMTLAFILLPGNYSNYNGLGAYFLDFPSSLYFSSSIILLLLYNKNKIYKLMYFSFILLGVSVLMRYIAIIYALILYAPIFFLILTKNWNSIKKNLLHILIPISIFLILTLPFLFKHLKVNYFHYTELGYNYFTIKESFIYFLEFLRLYFSLKFGLALFIITGVGWFFSKKSMHNQIWINLILFAVVPILLIVILKTKNAPHAFSFFVPIFFIGLGNLIGPIKHFKKNALISIICMLLIIIASSFYRIHNYYKESNKTDENLALDNFLVNEIESLDQNYVLWDTFFFEYAEIPSVHSFYQTNYLPQCLGNKVFTVHEKYWQALFPDMNKFEIYISIINLIKNHDMVVVFKNSRDADKYLNNEISIYIASKIAMYVKESENWELSNNFVSKKYGTLSVYNRVKK